MSEYNGTLIYTDGLGTLIYTDGLGTLIYTEGLGALIYTDGLGTLIYTEGMGTSVTLSETLHHCIMVKGSSRCIEHLTARGKSSFTLP